jgi:hypothetical protein
MGKARKANIGADKNIPNMRKETNISPVAHCINKSAGIDNTEVLFAALLHQGRNAQNNLPNVIRKKT